MARGEGSEFRAPMAIAVIGGVITSTLLTLIVVPVVYTWMDRFTLKGGKKSPATVRPSEHLDEESAGGGRAALSAMKEEA